MKKKQRLETKVIPEKQGCYQIPNPKRLLQSWKKERTIYMCVYLYKVRQL